MINIMWSFVWENSKWELLDCFVEDEDGEQEEDGVSTSADIYKEEVEE